MVSLPSNWSLNNNWADQSIILQHRAVVSVTVADLVQPGHALSKDGAPSKGVSILDVGEVQGGTQSQELQSVS